MWDNELNPVRTFNLAKHAALKSSHIRAVCINAAADSRKILIGTRGSDVLEISTAEACAVDAEGVTPKPAALVLNGGVCLTSGHR